MDSDSPHTGQAKKKRAVWLRVVVATVALIIIGAVIAYFGNKNTLTLSPSSSKTTFDANTNTADSMMVIVNTRAQTDKTGSIAALQSDGKGNYKYMLIANGKPFNTMIFTPDSLYTCNNPSSPCLKYPRASAGSHAFDPSGFTYTPAEIKTLKVSAAYQGKQACPVGGGTCDVWSYGPKNDTKMFFVNTASKNIVAVTNVGYFGKTEMTTHIAYEYEAEHIAVPTNYENGPAQSQ